MNGSGQGGVDNLPPMLSQYLDYKRRYPDYVILFQVGDFYEIFFQDAVTVAHKLNLTLTSRDKNSINPVPMCGVPIATVDTYLERLLACGISAAVVSQTGTAGDGRIQVERKLSRMVTPGVRILAQNDQASGSLVAAVFPESEHEVAVAFSSVQNGRASVREGLSLSGLVEYVRGLSPGEVVLPSMVNGRPLDRRSNWVRRIENSAPIKFRAHDETRSARDYGKLSGFLSLDALGKRAVRLLIDYIDDVTVGSQVRIEAVEQASESGRLSIDASTRDNLELVRNARTGGAVGTLFAVINHTVSPGGERLLRAWILSPLVELDAIGRRQSAVAWLKNNFGPRDTLRRLLSGLSDLERIAARAELSVVTPRELSAVRDALRRWPEVCLEIRESESGELLEIASQGENFADLVQLLESALSDNPPVSLGEGETIRNGYNSELDEVREIRRNGQSWMVQYESQERERTGIASLKVRFNNVLGFFLEVTRANLSRVPERYERRQSTANAERFTTPELRQREEQVRGAEEREAAIERDLFEALRRRVAEHSAVIRSAAAALSTLDVFASLAEASDREDYVRPQVDESCELVIIEGRHPVLSKMLGGQFVSNSLDLSPGRKNCLVITGPNMGGKSTFLRQAALVVVLAQIGCFVPAKEARIGVVDRMFARIGASDNLVEGESTFMVEMREAAHILMGATGRSLLLIDEIGRGTATADGLAIAQAILEWITHKINCRTLFATHFHELTLLEGNHPSIANFSVGSIERGEEVVFTHEICPGPANRSYGIEVAKRAGLPSPVLERAKLVLKVVGCREEEEERRLGQGRDAFSRSSQIPLFSPASIIEKTPEDYDRLKNLWEKIKSVDVNLITPIQALQLLADLKSNDGL